MKPPLPEQVLKSHVALLGKTGSGKSNAAKTIVEYLLDKSERVCVIDPTGTWWGMRLTRDGKKASNYPIKILGGDRADLAIEHTHGAMIAEAIGTSHSAVIINTRRMSVGNRTQFFTDFAEALTRTNKGPLYLVVDEAHLFAPKGRVNDPRAGKMLAATNDMITLGRGLGLRIILISQRPQKVHNDALGSVETLIAMRLILPHDVAAIKDWIKEWADLEQGAAIVKSLPSLKTGDYWIWSPEQGVLDRRHFPLARTYDSGSGGETGDGPALKAIDLGDLATRMKSVVDAAKAKDTTALQAEISRLTRELASSKNVSHEKSADPAKLAAAEARGYDRGFKAGNSLYTAFVSATQKAGTMVGQTYAAIQSAQQALAERQRAANEKLPTIPQSGSPTSSGILGVDAQKRERVQPPPVTRMPSPAVVRSGDGTKLKKAERSVLIALAQYPNGRTLKQIAILTGYASNGGGFKNAIYANRTAGRLTGDGFLTITEQGLSELGHYEPLPHGDALLQHWMGQLKKAEREALRAIVDQYPDDITNDDLAAATHYEANGGGFKNALYRLNTLELIERAGNRNKASADLFG